MFITKRNHLQAGGAARSRRRRGPAVSRCDGAGADGAGQDRRQSRPPLRHRVRRPRRAPRGVAAGHLRCRLRVQPDSEAARGLPRPRHRGVRTVHANQRPRAHGGGMVHRRAGQSDHCRGRAARAVDRPDRGQDHRRRHRVPVDRGLHRGCDRLPRWLRPGLRLRLHQHDFVGESDDAAADGDQPADDVRAALRPGRHGARSAWRRSRSTAASSTRCATTCASCSRASAAAIRAGSTEYLDNVREIEQRIQRAEKQNATSVTVPDAPVGIPETFSEHMMLMFDLLAVAWQADMTRVFSYMLNRDVEPARVPGDRRQRAAPRDVAPRQGRAEARRPRSS